MVAFVEILPGTEFMSEQRLMLRTDDGRKSLM